MDSAKYYFSEPLKEGVILKRCSQFTMDVDLDGEVIKCHCPTTTRIGNIELKNIACLVSCIDDKKRKLKYTVEAISCDEIQNVNKKWIGINLILSNKIVEFLLKTHQMSEMFNSYKEIHRDVFLGKSKLDFLVDNSYLEVKTPLIELAVNYGCHIKTKQNISEFGSTDRFEKHIKELASSLKQHEKAILLVVNQYIPDFKIKKKHIRSTNYYTIKQTIIDAINKGVEFWTLTLDFQKDGVKMFKLRNTTDEVIDY